MTAVGLRFSLFMRLRHYPFVFRTVQAIFDHIPMVLSVSLHLSVIFLLTYDFYTESKDKVVSVPMFVVDLTDVKIGPMTNLPPAPFAQATIDLIHFTESSGNSTLYSKVRLSPFRISCCKDIRFSSCP